MLLRLILLFRLLSDYNGFLFYDYHRFAARVLILLLLLLVTGVESTSLLRLLRRAQRFSQANLF